MGFVSSLLVFISATKCTTSGFRLAALIGSFVATAVFLADMFWLSWAIAVQTLVYWYIEHDERARRIHE
jgi:hypothetical protein